MPNQDIKVAGRSDGSGTTDIFTSALSRFDAVFNSLVGPSELVNWGNSASVNAPAKNLITPNTRYLVHSHQLIKFSYNSAQLKTFPITASLR